MAAWRLDTMFRIFIVTKNQKKNLMQIIKSFLKKNLIKMVKHIEKKLVKKNHMKSDTKNQMKKESGFWKRKVWHFEIDWYIIKEIKFDIKNQKN